MESIGMRDVKVTVTVTPDFPLSEEGKVSSFCITGYGLSAHPMRNWEPVTVVTRKQSFFAPGISFSERNMVSLVVKHAACFNLVRNLD